jgi:hypothetical protein
MPDANPTKFDKLVAKLRELFELDKSGLDFGIYRTLQFYQQVLVHQEKHLDMTRFQIKSPLFIWVGSSVNAVLIREFVDACIAELAGGELPRAAQPVEIDRTF